MQIDKIELENFRLFAKQEFSFHPRFNLVIGTNGKGKTSLLRALAVALGGWAHAYIKDERNRRPILPEEVREVYVDQRFDLSKSTVVAATGQASIIDRALEEKPGFVRWTRGKFEGQKEDTLKGWIQYGNYPMEYPFHFDVLGQDTLRYIENGGKFNLPLIAFYECDRIWNSVDSINVEASARAKYSRFDAYLDCFHTGANHQLLGKWVLKNELASKQTGVDTPALLSIRAAAKAALPNCAGLRVDFIEGRVLVAFEDGSVTPFDHLSDGQRIMLGLFCDLARRAAILNPHLQGDACAQTKGVVLIDELDLHIHPTWQRGIIANLRKLFPLVQFICTTHSPFLIQAIGDGKLIPADGSDIEEFDYLSIEDIAEDIQGVDMPQRSQRYQEMLLAAEQYFTLLRQDVPEDDEQLRAFKRNLDELAAPFSDDPVHQALMNVERMARLGDLNK